MPKERILDFTNKPAPTIMVATPMYGGMCTGPYVSGLISTLNVMRQVNVPVFWAQIMNESLITRARNELVRIFLEKGFDYLMFIDADISFDGEAMAQLLYADRDVSCGLYPKKEIDWQKVLAAAQAGKEDIKEYGGSFVLNMVEGGSGVADEDGMVEVRHGGTGFMMIKRQVFEKLIPHVPTYRTSTVRNENNEFVKPLTHEFFTTSIDETGALLSEDYHFCDLWRKHGGKIYTNPFIKLEHVGTYVYTGDVIKAGGNLK